MVLFLLRSRIDVDLWFTDTSTLLRSRFEADLWFTWFVRLAGPTLWRPVKLGSVPVLHLKTGQTWFCFGLTLESRSNLVSTLSYVCLPGLTLHCQTGCASDFVTLVCLIGLTTLMPILFSSSGLTFWCQFFPSSFIYLDLPLSASQRDFKSSSVGIFENSDLVWILPSFSPKVFPKLLSGAQTFSLCIPVSDKTTCIWCNVLCNVWSWMACLSI